MTGSRPARRPRKRPKNIQKQVDVIDLFFLVVCLLLFFVDPVFIEKIGVFLQNVFPGLWLVGLTVDAYRVTDAPMKVKLFLFISVDVLYYFPILMSNWLLISSFNIACFCRSKIYNRYLFGSSLQRCCPSSLLVINM